MIIKKCLLVSTAVFSASLNAHNFVTSDTWCDEPATYVGRVNTADTTTPVPIGSVTISASELEASLSDHVLCPILPVNASQFPPNSSHREVVEFITPALLGNREHFPTDGTGNVLAFEDPDYQSSLEYQHTVAYAYCACASLNGDDAIDPSIIRPKIFSESVSRENHHQSFSYAEEGVSFSCQVCVPSNGVILNGGQ